MVEGDHAGLIGVVIDRAANPTLVDRLLDRVTCGVLDWSVDATTARLADHVRRCRRRLRGALGPATFAQLWARGRDRDVGAALDELRSLPAVTPAGRGPRRTTVTS